MGSDTFLEQLKNMYNRKSYFDKYGGDVWLCFILIAAFSSASTYFNISGKINSLKPNWHENRCNPSYMPFANIMNNNKNISALEYTELNFISCLQDMIIDVVKVLLQPIILAITMVEQAVEAMVALFNEMGVLIGDIIAFMMKLLGELMAILSNIFIVFQNFFHSILNIQNYLFGISNAVSNIGQATGTAVASVVATVFRVLINICKDVIAAAILLIIGGVGWMIFGGGKEVEAAEEDEAAAALETPFTFPAAVAMFIKGTISMIMGIYKIIAGLSRLLAGIVLLIIALIFLLLLFVILHYIVDPVFNFIGVHG